MPARVPASKQQAQALVEFAITVPLFLLLLFSMIDFARLFGTYESMVNATAAAARTYSITTNTSSAVYGAFNGEAWFLGFASGTNPQVVFTVNGGSTNTCTGVPLSSSTCGTFTSSSQGYVTVQTTDTFQFVPQFVSPFGVSYVIPNMTLTYTAKEVVA